MRALGLLIVMVLAVVTFVWRQDRLRSERYSSDLSTETSLFDDASPHASTRVGSDVEAGANSRPESGATSRESQNQRTVATAFPRTENEGKNGAESWTFFVDGWPSKSHRCAVRFPGAAYLTPVAAVEWLAALHSHEGAQGAIASVNPDQATIRWSGPIDAEDLAANEGRIDALPLLEVQGFVVVAGTEEPVADAEVRVRFDDAGPFEAWLLGDERSLSTNTNAGGRFSLPLPVGGPVTITAQGPYHSSASVERSVIDRLDLGTSLALVPRETIRVTLVGAEREPERHFAAHHLHGTRVRFRQDWSVDVPLDPALDRLEIAVGIPNGHEIETEITTFFPGTPSDYPDGLTVVLNGAALDLALEGTPPDDQPLVALAHFHTPEGVESFASRWIRPGEVARIPFSAPGHVLVDVAWKALDSTPMTLVQRSVDVRPGEATALTIPLPKLVRRIQVTHSGGEPITQGDVGFMTRNRHRFAQPGGALDTDGSYVIPDLGLTEIWLHGSGTADQVLFGGVPFPSDTATSSRTTVDLGKVVETQVHLRSTTWPFTCADVDLELCDGETGHSLTWRITNAEAALALRWFDASHLTVSLPSDIIWSPRTPIPLTPGTIEVPTTLRAWLALECGSRDVTALEHVESGLTLAALLADPSVRREVHEKGVRFWGVPAGTYRYALTGDQAARPVLEAPPLVWTKLSAETLR